MPKHYSSACNFVFVLKSIMGAKETSLSEGTEKEVGRQERVYKGYNALAGGMPGGRLHSPVACGYCQ